jgi:WD40 repeat protein
MEPGGEFLADEVGHPFITSLALSPDVRLLAIAGDDRLTTVDITTGRDLWQVTLAGHQTTGLETLRAPKVRKDTSARHIIFSPDGKLLATEDAYQRTVVFEASTGKVVHQLESAKGANRVAFSPDGKLIATGEDKAINLWDVTSGKLVRSRPSRNDKITCMAFSPDSKILATGYADGVFRLHDVIIGTDNATIEANKAAISSVTFSPDGKTLATGTANGTIKLWNWEGKALRTLVQYDKKESDNPPEDKPPTSSLRETRELVSGDPRDAKTDVLSLVFSHDGEHLASVNASGVATEWNVLTGKPFVTLGRPNPDEKIPGYFDKVLMMQFTLDDEPLTVGHGKDGTVWLWELSRMTKTLEVNRPLASAVAASPNGKSLVIADNESIALFRRGKEAWKHLWLVNAAKEAGTRHILFSPDGKLLACEDNERRIAVFEASTGKVVHSLEIVKGAGQSVAFSPDGKLIATGERASVNIWEVASGKLVRSINGGDDIITCLAFSPDGKILAAGCADGVLRLHDDNVSVGVVVSIKAHKTGISSVAFSPDGKTLATGSTDGVIKLWNWQDKAVRVLGQGDDKGANFVTFTDKGNVQGGDRIDALLGELIRAKRTNNQIIEALYLATLARLPTEIEKGFALKHLDAQSQRRQEALNDLVFSLTQTQEFRRHLEALSQRASGPAK